LFSSYKFRFKISFLFSS